MKRIVQKLIFLSLLMAVSEGNLFSMQRPGAMLPAAPTKTVLDKTIVDELNSPAPRLSAIMGAIQAGGDANLGSKKNGVTPLILALRQDFGVARELLARRNVNKETATKSGITPLMVAVNKNDADIVKLLLDAGVKVDAADENGRTALARAAKGNCGMPKTAVAAEPSAASAARPSSMAKRKPEEPRRAPGPDIRTVVVEPTETVNTAPNCSLAVVEMLLAAGANPNGAPGSITPPGTAGLTRPIAPLNISVNRGNDLVAERLVDAGAKPEGARGYAPTPLYVAAQKGFPTLVDKLLKAGAKRTVRYQGMTPLEIAEKNKHDAVVAILRAR